MKQRWFGALAGIGAAVTALGVGELVAAAVSSRSAPLVAVGGVVVDNVPESAKEFAISIFGTNDKLALQVGTVIILIIFAGLIGMAALRRLWLGLAGIALFGVVGLV